MADVSSEIERLVREVLAELQHAPSSQSDGPARATTTEPPMTEPASAAPGELVVTSRVVTLAELGERLAGVRRLVVPPKAIVTPSLRDELRRRNVELVTGQCNDDPLRQSPAPGLVVFVHGKDFDAAPLLQAMANDGVNLQPQQSDCIIAATEELALQLARDAMGVLLTQHTAAGICLANRHSGVRAILAINPDGAAADAASVGANLLVLDPTRSGLFRAKQIISHFFRLGPHQCPKVFERLLKSGSIVDTQSDAGATTSAIQTRTAI